jgi:hypothetical protein
MQAERAYHSALKLIAGFASGMALLAWLALALYGREALSFDVSGGEYQGLHSCTFVADIYSGRLADSPTNRFQVKLTEDCAFCAESWSVIGSPSFRVRIFVRPCRLAWVARQLTQMDGLPPGPASPPRQP